MLKAKTEEQKNYIKNVISEVAIDCNVNVDDEWIEINADCGWVGDCLTWEEIYISYDEMAEVIDYLRSQNCEQEIAKSEEYNRLLDENRKLFNEWERLKKENETLKEKTKHLPRIATLNKRIHELRQENEKLVRQLSKKDYKE